MGVGDCSRPSPRFGPAAHYTLRRPARHRAENKAAWAQNRVRRELREHARPITVNTPSFVRVEWSCRESNPGPLTSNQAFSERSLQISFLSPGARADTSPTGSVAVKVPHTPRDRECAASLLSEAGYWIGGGSRPTLRLLLRQQERSQCALRWHLLGFQGSFTR